MADLALFALRDFPLIAEGDDLLHAILACMGAQDLMLESGDVLVIAQKVVSKSEGRYVDLNDIEASPRAVALAAEVDKDPRLIEVILSESTAIVRQCPGVLIVEHRLGYVMANAGIDASNVETREIEGSEPDGSSQRVLLLPEAPDDFARRLRTRILNMFAVNVGVIVNDSVGRAWRNGTTSLALGASGLPSLWDRRGESDLFGRRLEVTEVGLADQVASAAALVQGEGAEGRAVVLLRGLDLAAMGHANYNPASALLRDKQRDLFR